MSPSLESSVVRIYARSGNAIGAGFLVGKNQMLTCAHVVEYALGFKKHQVEMPTEEISLDFPRIAPGKILKAKVVFWRPVNPGEKYEDIAGLELTELPPNSARPVRLVTAEDLWGHSFRAFGFPSGQSNGVFASGQLRGRIANGWVQIEDIKEAGYRLEEGFSGAPVWDETLQGVAGMAVAAEKKRLDAKAAFIIPVDLLIEAWDVLQEIWNKRLIAACPYRGLFAFQEKDAELFFGREDLTTELVKAVEHHKIVPLIGPSGSGKSSVVFAGLFPQLRDPVPPGQLNIYSSGLPLPKGDGRGIRGVRGDRKNWLIEAFRPKNHPFDELARALLRLKNPKIESTREISEAIALAKQLKEVSSALETWIGSILEGEPNARLLLVADQFEEIFKTEDRQQFLQRLLEVVRKIPRVTLLFTMRADFMENALSDPILADALDNDVKVKPMSPQQLQDAIAKPASGLVQIESGLTARILEDALTESASEDATGESSREKNIEKAGYLPLVEFALEKLWQKQDNGRLTHQAYEDIGGVKGAIARHANQVFQQLSQNLSDREAQEKAQQIFIQLVHPGQNNLHTRQIATRSQLGEEKWNLVAYLAGEDCRLVVTNRNQVTKEETVELIHEALIREWQLFGDWIKENRDFRIWQDQLRIDMRSGDLLRDNRLTRAEYWLQERGDELSEGEKAFIQQSVRKREGDRRRTLMIATAVGCVMTSLSVVSVISAIRAKQQEQIATQLATEANIRAGALLAKNLVNVEPVEALTRAIQVTGKSQEKLDKVLPTVQSSLSETIQVSRERNLFPGHEDPVNSVAFSPDGSKIVSGSWDGTIRLWDVDTGAELAVLKGHESRVDSVAFSPDGSKVVSGSWDNTIRLWDVNSGAELAVLKGHEDSVYSVAFSPDGSKIVSGSNDNTIRLWDVDTGAELAVIKGHESRVDSVAFSPDGSKIVSGSEDKTIRLWDVNSGAELALLKGHESRVDSVAFSPDGSKVVSGSWDNTIRLWDVNSGEELALLKGHEDIVRSVAFSPDGSKVVSGSWDRTIRLWDVNSGAELALLKGHEDIVLSVAFSPDGSKIVSGSNDRTIRLWDVNSGEELALLEGHEDIVLSVAFSPDGSKIVSGSNDNTIRLWDVNSGEELAVLKGHESAVGSVAFSPDGSKVVSGSNDRTIRLWDVDTGAELAVHKGHEFFVYSVAFSPDGSKIVSGSSDKTIRLWGVDTGAELAVHKGHESDVISVAFSPDGSKIVSGSLDNTIRLWDVNSGAELALLKGHESGVISVAFSPDGSKVVSGSGDRTIRLWDVDTGEELAVHKGHEFFVYSVAFSPDGSKVVSGSRDRTIRLWDVNSGEELAVHKGHESAVGSVAFSPDGSKVVSGSWDNTIRVWPGTWQGWLQVGCDRLRLHPVFVEGDNPPKPPLEMGAEDNPPKPPEERGAGENPPKPPEEMGAGENPPKPPLEMGAEDTGGTEIAREAVKICEKAVEKNGEPIWSNQEKAELKIQQGLAVARLKGDLEQAKVKFQQAQDLDPEFYASLDYDPEVKARGLVEKND